MAPSNTVYGVEEKCGDGTSYFMHYDKLDAAMEDHDEPTRQIAVYKLSHMATAKRELRLSINRKAVRKAKKTTRQAKKRGRR